MGFSNIIFVNTNLNGKVGNKDELVLLKVEEKSDKIELHDLELVNHLNVYGTSSST